MVRQVSTRLHISNVNATYCESQSLDSTTAMYLDGLNDGRYADRNLGDALSG